VRLVGLELQIGVGKQLVRQFVRLQAQLAGQFGGSELANRIGVILAGVVLTLLRTGVLRRCNTFHRDADFVTDANDPLRFLIGIAVQLGVLFATDQDTHFVVVDLAELVEVEAGDNAQFLVEIALGMQVFAEAGADIRQLAQPADLHGLQLTFPVNHAHIDLQPVLVGQQFLHPVVELQVRTDQDQTILGVLDQLFKEIVGRAGVQKLCHQHDSAS